MAYQPKSYRKFVATAATATLVATAVTPAFAAENLPFGDVNKNYAEAVGALYSKNIVSGISKTEFGTYKNLTRGDAAVIIAKAKGLDTKNAPDAGFKDVNSRIKGAVNALVAEGIMDGVSGDKFDPNAPLTRGAMAKILVNAFDLKDEAKETPFTDLTSTFKPYIEALYGAGITGGTTKTTYGTNKNITRGDFANLLYKAMNHKKSVPESIKALNDITVDEGTKLEDVKLPEKVTVVYSDKSEKEASVKWDTSKLDLSKPDTYKLEGTVDGTDLKASVNVVVKAVAPKVESVSAINAGELVVKFNKAIKKDTVIEASGTNKDTLVDGIIKLNGNSADSLKAELSEDGKTLTIFADSSKPFDGAYTFELLADNVKSYDDKYVDQYKTTFSVDDNTRTTVTGVKQVSKYVFDISLSEPVAATSLSGISAKYADGTSVALSNTELRDNNKTIRVTLDSNTEANKEIAVTIPSLTDLKGNISVPTTTKVTVSDADKTKPTVVSAVATSTTEVTLKFSEPLLSVDDTKVKLNGSPVGSGNAKLDDKDNTILKVTVPAQTSSAALSLDPGAVTDLNGNPVDAWNQVVNFAEDKTAPEVSSYKVVKKADGFNYLQLQFSEKVKVPTSGFTALTFKYKDEFGVTQSVTVPAANVAIDPDDPTIVNVKLADTTSVKLKEDTDFTVKFGKGYFTDLFNNESVEKEITFTNSGTATESKLRLASGTPITNGVNLDGAYIDVNFASPVDPTSATNTSNYVVEGAEVSKAELLSNNASGATVRVYLKDDTVEQTGYYNVTVKGVKGYYSNVKEMDPVTKNISIKENTRPTVKSKAVKSFASNSTTIDVTFTEAVKDNAVSATTTNDYTLYVDGKATSSTVTGNESTTANGALITFTIDTNLAQAIADGKSVKLVAKDTLDLTDDIGNKVNAPEIVIK